MNLYVLVFIFTSIFIEAVFGIKTKHKEKIILEVEPFNRVRDVDESFVIAGQSKEISCKASAKSYDKKMEWYNPSGELVKKRQAGRRVYTQERFNLIAKSKALAPSLVLNLSHASVEDSGIWQCRYGDIVEEFALCVIDPTGFVDTPSIVTLDAGRSISLTCQTSGNPLPRVLWYRNGEQITESSDLSKYMLGTKFNSQFVEFFLTVKSVEADDAGMYTCEAQQVNEMLDDCSATTSFNISLQVNHRPTFDDNEEIYLFVSNNKSAILQCEAKCFPKPIYKWFKINDDETLNEVFDFVVAEDGSQSNLSASTTGTRYKCEAENRYGEAEKYFNVLELRKPLKPSLISVDQVYDVEVVFGVTWAWDDDSSYPFPVDEIEMEFKPASLLTRRGTRIVTYFENTTVIHEHFTNTTVSLEQLEPETEYSVKFSIINEAGASPWSAPIFVKTVSLITDDIDLPQFKQLTFPDEPIFSTGVIVGLVLTVAIIAFAGGCITIIKKL